MEAMLWDMPISWLNQIIHAHLYVGGCKTRRAIVGNKSDFDELAKMLGVSLNKTTK